MRAVRRAGLALGVCLGIFAHAPGQVRAQQRTTTTDGAVRAVGPQADSIRAFAGRMVALLRARNVEALIGLYADTAHYVHVENGVVIPWTRLSQMMRTYFATATSNPVRIVGEPGVTLIDRDVSVVYVTHHFDAANGQPAHDGVWTGVLRRDRTGWKIVHSHSSDGPPNEQAR